MGKTEAAAIVVLLAVVLAVFMFLVRVDGVRFSWPKAADWFRLPGIRHVSGDQYSLDIPPLFALGVVAIVGTLIYWSLA